MWIGLLKFVWFAQVLSLY